MQSAVVAAAVAGVLLTLGGSATPHADVPRKLLVAHRGASAYRPEHTLSSYRLALEHQADFVEQDLALTKDGVLVCLHDPGLERTTDVETRFPDRYTLDRSGGAPVKRWLAADFTLAELKQLDAGSWFGPTFAGERIPTFQEAIDLVRGKAGLFPELKAPDLYRQRGLSLEQAVVEILTRNGLDSPTARTPVILQSFDANSIRELARLLPRVPRVLLVEPAAAPSWLASTDTVKTLASFATGVGPHKSILEREPAIVSRAHEAGLTVVPWTFRASGTGRFPSVRDEMAHYLFTLGVDGVFTDNPDEFPRTAPQGRR